MYWLYGKIRVPSSVSLLSFSMIRNLMSLAFARSIVWPTCVCKRISVRCMFPSVSSLVILRVGRFGILRCARNTSPIVRFSANRSSLRRPFFLQEWRVFVSPDIFVPATLCSATCQWVRSGPDQVQAHQVCTWRSLLGRISLMRWGPLSFCVEFWPDAAK